MRHESVENLDDGCVRVCLTEQALTICTIISSHHLIPDKWRQLNSALDLTQGESEYKATQLN